LANLPIINKLKVSVITVCFNAGHLLPRTINSVLDQSYSNFEYIVVDGASKDETCTIVQSYGTKINQFLYEPDSGIYDAMNKGISLASGNLIIFLNAGDYFVSKDVLDFAISKMRYNHADVFYGKIVWSDPISKDLVLSDHQNTVYDWDLKFSNFPHPATFYKKEVFQKVGLFDLSYKILSDYEWNARALIKHRISFQYLNSIITLFVANGVSNNPVNIDKILVERKEIYDKFFKINRFLEILINASKNRRYLKYLAKLYSNKLKRIY
jgi:glycosyltransferase involved in cell wall biosynthesis